MGNDSPVKKGRYLFVDKDSCKKCANKPCIKVCPSGVFNWNEEENNMQLSPQSCVDWGACLFVCPFNAIVWSDEDLSVIPAKAKEFPKKEFSQPEIERFYLLGIFPEPEEDSKAEVIPVKTDAGAKAVPDKQKDLSKKQDQKMSPQTRPAAASKRSPVLTKTQAPHIIVNRIKNISDISKNYISGSFLGDRERKRLKVLPKGKNEIARVFLLVLAIIILLLTLLYINRDLKALSDEALRRVEEGVYYSADSDWTGWSGKDYEIDEGVLTISQDIYYAPYLMKKLAVDEFPWNKIVVKMKSKLEDFGGMSYNLMTFYTTTGDLSFVVDYLGRLGVVRDPDTIPEYSRAVITESEHDIHFFINIDGGEIGVYVDGVLIFNEERDLFMFGLLEVWLGAFWIGGGNGYGAPESHVISEFIIGDDGLLFFGYSFKQYLSDKLADGFWLWFVIFLPLLVMILYLFLLIVDLKKRKSKEFIEYGE